MQEITHTAECLDHTEDAIFDNTSMEFDADDAAAWKVGGPFVIEATRRVQVALADAMFCAEHGCC